MTTRTLRILAFSLALFAMGAAQAQAEQTRPKNVVIMISDGCGFNHMAAASLFLHGKVDAAVYHTFDVKLAMATFPANGSYSPDKAWEDFNYVTTNYTDSAAAGTAIATGVKTANGVIGMNAAFETVPTVLERAEQLGKATGVVSSVLFTSATPAVFAAHNRDRHHYAAIGEEMVLKSEVDVIMGPGHPMFDANGKPRQANFRYIGGPEVWWNAMKAGEAGADVDADHNGVRDDAWTMIETREQFKALATGPAPKRVFGLPQSPMALQQERDGIGNPQDDLPFEAPLVENVPTLPEMTAGALNVLDGDPDGFFLMIEGGAVDLTGHRNQSGRLIEEQADFDKAVETVVEWVKANSSWEETLLIVTADHETGYLTGSGAKDASVPLTVNKAGEMPAMQWNSGNHTNSLVPLFANGAGSKQLAARVVGTDPKRGPYIDNTAVGLLVFDLWK